MELCKALKECIVTQQLLGEPFVKIWDGENLCVKGVPILGSA